jgi:HK97 family phage portal protein
MLIDRIARGARNISTKFNPAMGAIVIQGMRTPAWTSANYHSLAREGYTQNVDVKACIHLIASAFAGAPWIIQSKKGSSKPKLVESGPLVDILTRPNPRQGMGSFMENVAAYQEISGNTYIFRFGLKIGPPRELYTLRPDRTFIVQSGNPIEPIEKYEYRGIRIIDFLPDRYGQTVSHWASFHPIDDFYGLSPLAVASRQIDQSNAGEAWNTSLFQNRCQPSGALKVGDPQQTLTDGQFNRLQDQIRTQYSGSMNAGLPMILEGGLEWQQMSLSPVDVDWLNGDIRATEKICRAFGVPPELIGVRSKGGLNDSNFVQARKQFWLEKMLPMMDRFSDVFNNDLAPLWGDEFRLAYDKDQIEAIQEDRETVFTRTLGAVKSSVMQVNEGRVALGLPEMPGWDVLLVPTGVTIMEEPGVSVGLPEPVPGGETVPLQNAPAVPARTPKQPPSAKPKSEGLLDDIAEAMLHGAGMR